MPLEIEAPRRGLRALCVVMAIAACSHGKHIAGTTVGDDEARAQRELLAACASLTGARHDTCMRLGVPSSPGRDAWASASWWLYVKRGGRSVPGRVEDTVPILCASYVAFDAERVDESNEQCFPIHRYEP
jgi:hypothetical protein